MKKLYQEDLWNKILEEVELFSNDKTMEYYFKSNILNFNKLSDALSLLVSKNLKSQEINEENIIHDVGIAFTNKDIIDALSIEKSINSKTSYGGTSIKNIKKMISKLKKEFK